MTRKQRRLTFVVVGMILLAAATGLVLNAFRDNLVFFHTPTEVAENKIPPERRFRLGGLVEEGSVGKAADGVTVTFRVTDTAESVAVSFKGLLPDLFREGQGVVVEGQLDRNGQFVASEVLAKHGENYMPPEATEAIKKAGQWKGD